MNWQDAGPIALFGIAQLVALIGAYYGLKADNAALGTKLELSLLAERAARLDAHGTLKEQIMGVIARVETSVTELAHRVANLESGQDEWTKSLRARTHELSNLVNSLVLKVDRLERTDTRK